MSKTKRRMKAAKRASFVANAQQFVALDVLREAHLKQHPNCTYGNKPHFVPPSLGQIGFYMCDVPADLRNHTRCGPPFDHSHPDHYFP